MKSYEDQLKNMIAYDYPRPEMVRVAMAADKEVASMKGVLIEAMRLLKNGANGAITDTVWSDNTPNATLYELMHNLTNGKDDE